MLSFVNDDLIPKSAHLLNWKHSKTLRRRKNWRSVVCNGFKGCTLNSKGSSAWWIRNDYNDAERLKMLSTIGFLTFSCYHKYKLCNNKLNLATYKLETIETAKKSSIAFKDYKRFKFTEKLLLSIKNNSTKWNLHQRRKFFFFPLKFSEFFPRFSTITKSNF